MWLMTEHNYALYKTANHDKVEKACPVKTTSSVTQDRTDLCSVLGAEEIVCVERHRRLQTLAKWEDLATPGYTLDDTLQQESAAWKLHLQSIQSLKRKEILTSTRIQESCQKKWDKENQADHDCCCNNIASTLYKLFTNWRRYYK